MNNEVPDNLLPPPTRNARTPDVRTADILSAQTGPTPAVQSPTKAQRRTTVREPNLFDAAETAE